MEPFVLEFDVHFCGQIRLRTTPVAVSVLGLNITKEANMPANTCTPQLSPLNQANQVTSRPVRIDFNDGTPSLNLDMIDPAASFQANDGQQGTVTALGDINVNGQGQVTGVPFTFNIGGVTPPGPPTGVPDPVSVIGLSVVPSPA